MEKESLHQNFATSIQQQPSQSISYQIDCNQRLDFPPHPPSYGSIQSSQSYTIPPVHPPYPPHQNPFTLPNPLENLSQALGQHSKFSFVQLETLGLGRKEILVQIHDMYHQPIMSATHRFGQTVRNEEHLTMVGSHHTSHMHSHRPSTYIGSVTQIMNSFGQIVITTKETERGTFVVTSGDVVLGSVKGFGVFSSSIKVKNSMGEPIFHIFTGDDPQTLYNIRNGQEVQSTLIGKVTRRQPEYKVSLHVNQNLDTRTKALVLVTTFILYAKRHAETIFGSSGGECGCC